MAKKRMQFQKGLSLPEFLAAYGSEAQCAEALFTGRWPRGFVCPQCDRAEGYTKIQTRGLLQCKHCRHQSPLTAGTVFAYSQLPLTIWFLALYLLTQQKNAISALELKRQLGVPTPPPGASSTSSCRSCSNAMPTANSPASSRSTTSTGAGSATGRRPGAALRTRPTTVTPWPCA